MNRWIVTTLVILLLFVVLIGIFALFTKFNHAQKTVSQLNSSGPTPLPTLAGIPTSYTGLLPCADCSGIKTNLTFYRNNPSDTEGTYNIQETYLRTKTQPYNTRGKWKIIKGYKKDKNALVYFLTADNSGESTYFLKDSEDKVKLLNKQMGEIQSTFSYTLTKSSQ